MYLDPATQAPSSTAAESSGSAGSASGAGSAAPLPGRGARAPAQGRGCLPGGGAAAGAPELSRRAGTILAVLNAAHAAAQKRDVASWQTAGKAPSSPAGAAAASSAEQKGKSAAGKPKGKPAASAAAAKPAASAAAAAMQDDDEEVAATPPSGPALSQESHPSPRECSACCRPAPRRTSLLLQARRGCRKSRRQRPRSRSRRARPGTPLALPRYFIGPPIQDVASCGSLSCSGSRQADGLVRSVRRGSAGPDRHCAQAR